MTGEVKADNCTVVETSTCPYCNKEMLISEMVAEDVWVNHGRYHMLFCSREHAMYYQMGAEG